MKSKQRPSFIIPVCALLPILMFVFGHSAFAQPGTKSGGVSNSGSGPFTSAIERRNREIALRSVELEGQASKSDQRVSRAMLEQLNEDFKQLQIVRLAMVSDIKNGKPFEYKRLSEDSGEIKKRASRLQSSLVLFDHPDGVQKSSAKVQFDKAGIQDAASELCLEISRFTENPMFKTSGVYNARNAAEADQALDTVIRLAANIKSSAENLRRANP